MQERARAAEQAQAKAEAELAQYCEETKAWLKDVGLSEAVRHYGGQPSKNELAAWYRGQGPPASPSNTNVSLDAGLADLMMSQSELEAWYRESREQRAT